MSNLSQIQRIWVLLGLFVFMLATRFHHFGSVNFLPDASMAVFFLAGFYLLKKPATEEPTASRFVDGSLMIFSLLLLEAGLIDYLAIRYGGVSDFCVTPAYLFLVPTYAVLLYAGKWCAQFNLLTLPGAFKTAGILFGAVTLAFLISNGSFYFFGDSNQGMDWLTYSESVSGYFLPFAGYSLLYVGLVLGAHAFLIKVSQPQMGKLSH